MSTTRGVLRLGTATVQVLITTHSDERTIGTAVIEAHDRKHRPIDAPPYHKVSCPTPKEAWAALATWIGEQLEEAAHV